MICSLLNYHRELQFNLGYLKTVLDDVLGCADEYMLLVTKINFSLYRKNKSLYFLVYFKFCLCMETINVIYFVRSWPNSSAFQLLCLSNVITFYIIFFFDQSMIYININRFSTFRFQNFRMSMNFLITKRQSLT